MDYFADIEGQDFACSVLRSQLDFNKHSHAYLFAGADGAGKLKTALAFSKALVGQEFADRIDANTFPDVRVYSPEGIHGYLAGQIKDIVSDANLAPIQAKNKIYILKEADKLGTSAANAFLKTLEEPPEYVCFILLTNSADNVLPTIASRCQIINFKSLPYNLAVKLVQKDAGCAMDEAQLALDLFGGNTSKAIEFCLDQNMQDLYDEVNNVILQMNNITDWELLKRSQDICTKINEIVDCEKNNLERKTKDLEEILESSAISKIKDQNKRRLKIKQQELMSMILCLLKLYYRKQLEVNNNNATDIAKLNLLSEFQEDLAYNISTQIFCDVIFLKLKNL